MGKQGRKKAGWAIHCCANHFCGAYGDNGIEFLPYLCNAHTHGMERFGHPDFQVVLRYSDKEIMRILNTFGLWVLKGRRFHDGELVPGVIEGGNVQLREFEESGRKVLRVIIPDCYNRFPEEALCTKPFCQQLLETRDLVKK